jgi:hypothetical protein
VQAHERRTDVVTQLHNKCTSPKAKKIDFIAINKLEIRNKFIIFEKRLHDEQKQERDTIILKWIHLDHIQGRDIPPWLMTVPVLFTRVLVTMLFVIPEITAQVKSVASDSKHSRRGSMHQNPFSQNFVVTDLKFYTI